MESQPPPAYSETPPRQNGFTSFSKYTVSTSHLWNHSSVQEIKPHNLERRWAKWIFPGIYSIFVLIALLVVTLGSTSTACKDVYLVRFGVGYTQFVKPGRDAEGRNSSQLYMGTGLYQVGDTYVSGAELGLHQYYQVGIFTWLEYKLQPTHTTSISIKDGIDLPRTLNKHSNTTINVLGLNYKPESHPRLNSANNAVKALQPLSIMAVVSFVGWWVSIGVKLRTNRGVPCGYVSCTLIALHLAYAICYTFAGTSYSREIRRVSGLGTTSVVASQTGLGLLWAAFVLQVLAAVFLRAGVHPASGATSAEAADDFGHHHHHINNQL